MIINGDSFEELKKLEDNSVDSIITDPPYDIGFMGKKWDKKSLITNVDFWKECLRVLKPGGHLLSFGHSRTSHRMVTAVEEAGFEIRDTIMWMYGSGFPKSHNVAIAIDKKLGKMGHRGVRSSFNGQKTIHGENIPAAKGAEQHQAISEEAKEWQGWGTALKPSYEPVTLARKPLDEKNVADNVMKWGTGAINIDESRVETNNEDFSNVKGRPITKLTNNRSDEQSLSGPQQQEALRKLQELGRFPANVILDKEAGELLDEQSGPTKASFVRNKTDGARPFNNDGEVTNYTTEKIDVEEDGKGASRYFKQIDNSPITLARKPLEEDTIADNVMKWGTGAINIDESRIGTDVITTNGKGNKFVDNLPHGQRTGENVLGVNQEHIGRFPANVILDEEAGEELDKQAPKTGNGHRAKTKVTGYGNFGGGTQEYNGPGERLDGLGGASRFFYCAKVSTKERKINCENIESKGGETPKAQGRNTHPTVKPVKLMEYLVKLVTKRGGVVLDPFAGSGSTGVACKNLGMKYIMIEREAEYCEIIKARLQD